jgi:hypothetical protein
MFKIDEILPDKLFGYQNHFNIQDWLVAKNCFLKDYQVLSHLFSDYLICICESMNVNPKLILVSLQREQSLISRHDTPTQERLNRALGVGCYDNGDNASFYGFQTQIDGCLKTYLKWFNLPIMPIKIDEGTKFQQNIFAKNSFTFAIYMYTPHVAAAELTYNIWRGWWPEDVDGKQQEPKI